MQVQLPQKAIPNKGSWHKKGPWDIAADDEHGSHHLGSGGVFVGRRHNALLWHVHEAKVASAEDRPVHSHNQSRGRLST